MAIGVSVFLAKVAENTDRIHAYHLGHDGSDGQCDCIGLIIGAIRLAGISYNHLHGSNYFIRNEVSSYGKCSKASDLTPGEIVFKAFEKGQSGWALPERYWKDSDQRDYYHVGVVVSVSPLQIWHCTSRGGKGGVYIDTKLGQWKFHARCKVVDYGSDATEQKKEGNEKTMATERMVYSENGKGANMRAKKDTKSSLLDRVPEGATVTVLEDEGEWSKITYSGKNGTHTGYVMSKYLITPNDSAETGIPDVSDGQADPPQAYVRTLTPEEYDKLGEYADQLEKAAAFIRTIVGVG